MLTKTTLLWAQAADRDADYADHYPDHYRRLRFEDLVASPETTIPDLFDFLDLQVTPGTFDQKVVSVGYKLGESGFDAGAATRWREQISAAPERWLRTTLGGRMRRLGYAT